MRLGQRSTFRQDHDPEHLLKNWFKPGKVLEWSSQSPDQMDLTLLDTSSSIHRDAAVLKNIFILHFKSEIF